MKPLQNRIDFCVIISVDGANPNGDPLVPGYPRILYDGHGEISDVCIKRKIRKKEKSCFKKNLYQNTVLFKIYGS